MRGRKAVKHGVQTSESILLSGLLALSGGLQDAYTYLLRDRVFANAQTGNIVLMSGHLMAGEWLAALRYLAPVGAFVAGILLAELVRRRWKNSARVHWRQLVLGCEIAVLAVVGLLPSGVNALASMLVSFTCAMQVEAFRKINGWGYASTMCIGNLRSGTEELFHYFERREKASLRKALCYYGVIALFALGAGLGTLVSARWGLRAIWCSCALLLAAALLMAREYR